MVKLREEFHREHDDTIEPNIWFQHLADHRPLHEMDFLQKAYQLALLSGEQAPAITGVSSLQYGLSNADILDNLGIDIETIIAGLLYPSVQFAELSLEDVREQLGDAIAKLIEGVSRMETMSEYYLSTKHHQHQNNQQIDNIRKMLLAMVDDVRVVLIKLADQTTLMRTCNFLGPTKQKQFATETRDVFAPLANRLGIAQIKWELEDYSFRYLQSDVYKNIAKLVAQKRIERENYIKNILQDLETLLKESDIQPFNVSGRAKHIFSIYKKMQRKNVDISKIYDVSAVRVMVPTVEDCYKALSLVHNKWEPIAEEFDDYINNPKPNGYRSLHTAVVGPQGRNVEIQFRTFKMHEEAELGVAAHWIYKEGGGKRSSYDQKISWLRQLIDWHAEIAEEEENALDTKTQQIFEDRVYTFTPTGEIVDLPTGSTPLDFAYAIHTEVGHRCRGAKINNKIVPLTYKLQMGDQVEILTAKQANPSRDWLNPNLGYLKSSRAKARIHHWFLKQEHEKNYQTGKELLEKELKRLHVDHFNFHKMLERYPYKNEADLIAALGAGTLKIAPFIHVIETELPETKSKELLQATTQPPKISPAYSEAVNIQGLGNLLYHLANCCKPLPGDDIIGYITRGRGVSIHRQDCSNILEATDAQKERFIEVNWGEKHGTYPVDLEIYAYDRHNLVRDITNVLSSHKINIVALTTTMNKDEHLVTVFLTLEVPNLSELSRMLDRLQQVPNVTKVYRKKAGT